MGVIETPFIFDDGFRGHMLESPYMQSIAWLREDLGRIAEFSFANVGYRSLFENDEDLILTIARSLTPAQ